MSDPLLEIRDLHVQFQTYDGTAKVINGIDLTIEEGQTVGLVGESGCGKSVTARTILGLLQQPPAMIPKGEVIFKGENLLDLSDEDRHAKRGQEMSLIMQDPMTSLSPVFTVGEQMTNVIKWQGKQHVSILNWVRDRFSNDTEVKEQAIEMLERVQISAPERVFSSYPVELSGGMRQRILIAIALLADPDFLIADEPGTALDVTTEAKILGLLENLVEDTGASVLYITHDLGVALEVSDRTNVMYAGEIVEEAPTKQLFEKPQHPYTRGLLDSIPKLLEGVGNGIPGHLPNYTDPPTGCRFAARCQYATDECREVYPYPRQTGHDHAVGCHLHQGPPIHPRDEEYAAAHPIDIGAPPWCSGDGRRAERTVSSDASESDSQ